MHKSRCFWDLKVKDMKKDNVPGKKKTNNPGGLHQAFIFNMAMISSLCGWLDRSLTFLVINTVFVTLWNCLQIYIYIIASPNCNRICPRHASQNKLVLDLLVVRPLWLLHVQGFTFSILISWPLLCWGLLQAWKQVDSVSW